jgi:hypothetical protein
MRELFSFIIFCNYCYIIQEMNSMFAANFVHINFKTVSGIFSTKVNITLINGVFH